MIDPTRFNALMELSIDPKLFYGTEVLYIGEDMARNPHQYLDELRASQGDVIEVVEGRAGDFALPTLVPMNPDHPGFLVTGYSTVKEVLTNQADFYQNYTHSLDILMGEDQIAGLNPPKHSKLRELIMQSFDKGSVDSLQEGVIIPLMKGLIDKIGEKHKSDLVEDFTCIMPTLLIGEIFQFPVELYPMFAKLVADLMNFNTDWETAQAASDKFAELFFELIASRRTNPGDDLISAMLSAEIDGNRLTEVEMMSFCRALVPAGIETTTRGLSSLFAQALENAEHWQILRSNPDLINPFVEETLRFNGPTVMIPKRTTRDLNLAGKELKQGTNLWICLGHANRDPSVWENPHQFDYTRNKKPHFEFSFGAHMCIGNQLARREMNDALKLMIEAFPSMKLDPEKPSPVVRGLTLRSADQVHVLTGVN